MPEIDDLESQGAALMRKPSHGCFAKRGDRSRRLARHEDAPLGFNQEAVLEHCKAGRHTLEEIVLENA